MSHVDGADEREILGLALCRSLTSGRADRTFSRSRLRLAVSSDATDRRPYGGDRHG
ncbi:hypothetical protein [Streptomyces sp. 900105755]